jgi:hypothetical protein
LIDTGTNKLFVRRNARGTSFKKVVDAGRSISSIKINGAANEFLQAMTERQAFVFLLLALSLWCLPWGFTLTCCD